MSWNNNEPSQEPSSQPEQEPSPAWEPEPTADYDFGDYTKANPPQPTEPEE
jgi:hypothetical protein